jgi:hypothetical protein
VSWLSLILAVIQLVNRLVQYGQEQKWIGEGEARQIAKAQAESIRKSGYAREVMAEVDAMSDTAVDDGLRDLEPGERVKPGS